MAEIQAPEDSVSFSDCVNLEMSKFFSVMLPIVKKKKKRKEKSLLWLLRGWGLWSPSSVECVVGVLME